MSCKDNKHRHNKQEETGDFSLTNFTDVHRFLNFQILSFSDLKTAPEERKTIGRR